MAQILMRVSTEQHRQLKTLASYSGMSMKEFILSHVFVEAAETVFSPKVQRSMKETELKTAQDILFRKAEVITVAPEKWESLKSKAKKA